MRVANDERHRHGFAEGAAEPEHDPADDPDPRVGHDHVADHLPGGAPEPIGGFLEHGRHRLEDVAGNRGDEGEHHDGEDQARGKHADAVGRTREQRVEPGHVAEQLDQRRLQRALQEWCEYEQPPDAVDDARDSGEQLDRDPDRPPQPKRTQLGQEHRNQKADRNGDHHGDQGSHQRPVDRGKRPELLGDRIPPLAGQEIEPERRQRRQRAGDQSQDHPGEHRQDRKCGGAGERPEQRIPGPQPAQSPRPRRRFQRYSGPSRQYHFDHRPPPGRLRSSSAIVEARR